MSPDNKFAPKTYKDHQLTICKAEISKPLLDMAEIIFPVRPKIPEGVSLTGICYIYFIHSFHETVLQEFCRCIR